MALLRRPRDASSTTLILGGIALAVLGGALLWHRQRSRTSRAARRLRELILSSGDASRVLAAVQELRASNSVVRLGADELVTLSCKPSLLPVLMSLLQARSLGNAAFDIDARASGGATALVAASAVGNTKAVSALVASGANPLVADDSGLCAAHIAAKYGHLGCLKSLVCSTEASKTDFALFDAQRSADGATPLMLAASENQARRLREEWRAAVPKDDPTLLTPLILALQVDVVAWLCSMRFDLDGAMSTNGVTALMLACQRDHVDVVRALLSAGASPDAAAADGRTALAIAAQHNALGSARELLAAGADPDGGCNPGGGLRGAASRHRLPSHPGTYPGVDHDVEDPANPLGDAAAYALSPGPRRGPSLDDLAAVQTTAATDVAWAIAPTRPVSAVPDAAWPVVQAARRGFTDMLRILVDAGALPNPTLRDGRPLLLAAVEGFPAASAAAASGSQRQPQRIVVRPETVAALLELGADPGAVGGTAAEALANSTDKRLRAVWEDYVRRRRQPGGA